MAEENLHVVTHDDQGWAIRREGSDEVLSSHSTQNEAIDAASSVALDEEGSVYVHNSNGQIDHVKSYDDLRAGAAKTDGAARPRPVAAGVRDASLGSRVRWSAVFAGLVVTMTLLTALTVLGTALGLCLANVFNAEWLAVYIGVWAALSMLVSLLVGGYAISRLTVGEDDVIEPGVYGLLLWGLMFVVLPFLPLANLDFGFGSFSRDVRISEPVSGKALSQAGLNDEQAVTIKNMSADAPSAASIMRGKATEAAWLTFAAMLLSMLAAIAGATMGAQFGEDRPGAKHRVKAGK